jgi:predicted nucleotidyltransferase
MEVERIDLKVISETTELKEKYPDTDEKSLIKTIVELMEKVEDFVDMTGIEKKAQVLAEIKMILGQEVYVRYYYFINQFIDYTIELSRGSIKLNLNNYKKRFCCFKK